MIHEEVSANLALSVDEATIGQDAAHRRGQERILDQAELEGQYRVRLACDGSGGDAKTEGQPDAVAVRILSGAHARVVEGPRTLGRESGEQQLRQVPAAIRFISVEPLLGPIEGLPRKGIHWVIAGGESGPRAREMKPEWARSIRDQCVDAGVPFFFKQWGGVQRKLAGRRLDRREWNEMPATAVG